MTDDDLPSLPEPSWSHNGARAFSRQAMHDYARAAIRHWVSRQRPVAWASVWGAENWLGGVTGDAELAAKWRAAGGTVVALFRLDGGGDE